MSARATAAADSTDGASESIRALEEVQPCIVASAGFDAHVGHPALPASPRDASRRTPRQCALASRIVFGDGAEFVFELLCPLLWPHPLDAIRRSWKSRPGRGLKSGFSHGPVGCLLSPSAFRKSPRSVEIFVRYSHAVHIDEPDRPLCPCPSVPPFPSQLASSVADDARANVDVVRRFLASGNKVGNHAIPLLTTRVGSRGTIQPV